MRKNIVLFIAITGCALLMASCGGKTTAASIAQKWCDLNGKAYRAAEGPEKEAAEKALHAYENEVEGKYEKDEAFMKEIEREVEKCEDVSEGRE